MSHPAGVDVAVAPDRHVWTLEEWPITALSFEQAGVRLAVRTPAGSAEIRVGGRFRLEGPASPRVLDPADTPTLAPLLPLRGLPLRRIEVAADGELTLSIGDRVLVVRPDPRFEAWDAQGSGVLDGLAYRCPPGGAPPWTTPPPDPGATG